MKRIVLTFFSACVIVALAGAFAGEPGSSSDPLVTKSFLEQAYGWKITTLPAGEKLSLELGNEAVLRAGKAVVVGKKGGLVDLTLGQDLPDLAYVPPNHHLVCASAEGRGLKALGTAVFLTRGLAR